MAEYTPTEAQVAVLWERFSAEFNRWLDEVRREAAAEGYDRGLQAGWQNALDGNFGTDWWADDTPNPYRKEQP